MTPRDDFPFERWAEIDALISAALDLPSEMRAAFLEERCGDDAALLSVCAELLVGDDEAESSLEARLAAVGPAVAAELTRDGYGDPLRSGVRVGPYLLLRELGRGGAGVVFMAERVDGHYSRRVAIKVLRRGLDTDELVARFRAERQILAALAHPNIAALLDGGATADGRPFLVMELVEGTPIDDYCDARRLPLAERLRLFLEVARAVQYAHGRLVVHRDLKPSNILVTPDGIVKLLDFGIAKLLDPAAVAEDAPRTRTEVRILTPEYASPEQIRGDSIGTATDVYQLGLLLYELLTGRHAHRSADGTRVGLERAICEDDPLPPSVAATTGDQGTVPDGPAQPAALRRTTPRELAGRLRGDLDAIVLTALRKEPEARYATADAMIADVVAYLEGRPVTARPASRTYRLRKFVRRHPVGTAAAIALALLVSGHAVTLGAYNQRLAQERDRAEVEARKAERVRDFLVSMFETADPAVSQGAQLTVPELLERSAARLGALEGEPEIHAAILEAMGQVYGSMQLYREARPVLLGALEYYRATLGEDHPRVADLLGQLGHIERFAGTHEAAARYYEQALAIKVRNYGPVHPDVACSLNNLGLIASNAGDNEAAIRYYSNALEMRASFVGRDSPCLARIINNLAIQYRTVGDLEAAERLHRESIELRRRQLGDIHPDVATALSSLGITLRRRGALEEAETAYQEALFINWTVLGADHPEVATVFGYMANLMNDRELRHESIALHRTALAIRRHVLGHEHRDVAASLHNLGTVLRDAGFTQEAAETLYEAHALRHRLLGPEAPATVRSRQALEGVMERLGGSAPGVLAVAHAAADPEP